MVAEFCVSVTGPNAFRLARSHFVANEKKKNRRFKNQNGVFFFYYQRIAHNEFSPLPLGLLSSMTEYSVETFCNGSVKELPAARCHAARFVEKSFLPRDNVPARTATIITEFLARKKLFQYRPSPPRIFAKFISSGIFPVPPMSKTEENVFLLFFS